MTTTQQVRTEGRKLTRKGEQRRNEILEASAELFDRCGYHQATIALIAEEIGTTKANVYHYFKAKHDILFASHEAWIEDLISRFDEDIAPLENAEEQVRMVIQHVVDIVAERRSQVRVYFEYLRELPDDLRRLADQRRDEYTERVEGILARGMANGDVRDMPLRVTTFGLFGIVNWTYQWYRPGGAQTPEQVADQIFEMFWRGIAAEPR
ncbi:TetR/AcrR family transcriptional regulator [Alloalcanivorax gelatiniphagus]